VAAGSDFTETAAMFTLPHLLQSSPLAFTIMAGVVGLMVGSFSADITRKRISLH
jgi:hypothetical protein